MQRPRGLPYYPTAPMHRNDQGRPPATVGRDAEFSLNRTHPLFVFRGSRWVFPAGCRMPTPAQRLSPPGRILSVTGTGRPPTQQGRAQLGYDGDHHRKQEQAREERYAPEPHASCTACSVTQPLPPPLAMHALVKLTLGTGYVGQGSDHIL